MVPYKRYHENYILSMKNFCDIMLQKKGMIILEEKARTMPNYLDLAKTMIAALEKQESDISGLQRVVGAQIDINRDFENRLKNLEQKQSTEPVKQEKKTEQKEKATDSRSDNLEDELRKVFGVQRYISPDMLFWILGRK